MLFGIPCSPSSASTSLQALLFLKGINFQIGLSASSQPNLYENSLKLYDEIPYGVAVKVEEFEEKETCALLSIQIFVNRESHKKMIIGQGGSLLKRIGTDARKRLEELLGKQVMMCLQVQLSPFWYNDEERLRAMGYTPH
ncbi:KH domain-containing protein [Pajaroellobacter abortibovis]|uniref:KH type-2 domain-containing protein n=1 Tax=Pajaroellobacter abortibovis TaxID=1882918 RepID=A0A1L6MY28_9BACT|nr:KH domain-containing protein [Pajaroellobacter abortibovis]APS00308.1 hypothetical protein BCY86_06145 [Pajaroellobacter abortibovis]